MFVFLLFAGGLLSTGALAVVAIRWRRLSVKRGLLSLLLALPGFVIPLWMNEHGFCPPKSIANLGEFVAYGLICGVIPLGQFFRLRKVPGELVLAVLVWAAVVGVYKTTPTLPETPYGWVPPSPEAAVSLE